MNNEKIKRELKLFQRSLIISGLLPVLLGTLLFVFPAEGTVSWVWLIGGYTIIAGLIELIFAFRLGPPRTSWRVS